MAGLYINTDLSSMIANRNLQATAARLTETTKQLATGYRINSAKDDPAGLIASEQMRSDIVAMNRAARNTEMADITLSVADGAMGQISSLLTEARGLAVEAANTGAMSPQQIQANQQQMDAILNSIDRIANTTRFLGNRLIDGSRSVSNGGATYQIGSDVNAQGQVNVPIAGMSTTHLGGEQGLLYQLRSGGEASLATNPAMAESILKSALSQVSMQRGAVGATRKYTFDTNIKALEENIVQTTAAEGMIRNVDFAMAASNRVRDQILMGVGARVASIANQSRADIASLLG